ncbi:hypothetical protein WJX73_000163 [Symbiochloris irregularis]|uniref:Protein kinase domain-containing protein n=1 Tax=Symbiochloris irregularis TaxID=706552 RepID=A0AAW1PIV3_9CHLO
MGLTAIWNTVAQLMPFSLPWAVSPPVSCPREPIAPHKATSQDEAAVQKERDPSRTAGGDCETGLYSGPETINGDKNKKQSYKAGKSRHREISYLTVKSQNLAEASTSIAASMDPPLVFVDLGFTIVPAGDPLIEALERARERKAQKELQKKVRFSLFRRTAPAKPQGNTQTAPDERPSIEDCNKMLFSPEADQGKSSGVPDQCPPSSVSIEGAMAAVPGAAPVMDPIPQGTPGTIIESTMRPQALPELAQVYNVAYSDKYDGHTRYAMAKMAGRVKGCAAIGREMGALIECQHENVIPVLQGMSHSSMTQIDPSMPAMCAGIWMPLPEGGSAADVLSAAKGHGLLAAGSIASIVRPVASALTHMHGLGWVHGRVALQSVLLSTAPDVAYGPCAPIVNGPVWISSFSSAKEVGAEPEAEWGVESERHKDVADLGRVLLSLLFMKEAEEGATFPKMAVAFASAPETRAYYKAAKAHPTSQWKRLGDLARQMLAPNARHRPGMAEVVDIIDNIMTVEVC